VTDHRLQRSFNRLPAVMTGGEQLHEIVEACQQQNLEDRFKEHLEKFMN